MSAATNLLIQERWSEEHQRKYRVSWNGYDWVFLGWNVRHDSHSGVREGRPVIGSYNLQNPQPYETLHPSFIVRDRSYFQQGRVFAVLFSESVGATVTDYNTARSAFTQVSYGESVFTQIRRFIVVRDKREFCFAVPIFTYNQQATTKRGVVPKEHAIAYSHGQEPQLIIGESPLEKDPICVIMNYGEPPLHKASRIYFAIHHPIQYNVKVKDLGYVHPEQMQNFLGYWHQENGIGLGSQPSQDLDVTAAATYETTVS